MDEQISLVGLGKLGLCLAASYAERGFDVLGVDLEENVVNRVNRGKAPWFEPGLDELLTRHGGKRLRATLSHQEAVTNTDLTIILVPTPSCPDGSFSNRFVESALRSMAEALAGSQKMHHLFVISSTIMPGSIEGCFIPILEKYSGRKLNKGFSVCYDPDFVALGNVIKGFLQPDLVIIGESTPEAGARVETLHRQLCENKPSISRMSLISAEVAKVCLNVYITFKISVANSIANLCEAIPGTDVDAITAAIGADRRISSHYFRGGLSFGGTCFPRDTHAYEVIAAKHNVQAEMVQAATRVNQYQDRHLTEVVLREVERSENKTVGILGLAFTSNTPVVTESPAIKLIREILKRDLRIIAYDPLAIETTKVVLGSSIEYASSAKSCLEKCGVVVVTLRSAELRDAVSQFQPAQGIIVVDCWRILDPKQLPSLYTYVPLGRARLSNFVSPFQKP